MTMEEYHRDCFMLGSYSQHSKEDNDYKYLLRSYRTLYFIADGKQPKYSPFDMHITLQTVA